MCKFSTRKLSIFLVISLGFAACETVTTAPQSEAPECLISPTEAGYIVTCDGGNPVYVETSRPATDTTCSQRADTAGLPISVCEPPKTQQEYCQLIPDSDGDLVYECPDGSRHPYYEPSTVATNSEFCQIVVQEGDQLYYLCPDNEIYAVYPPDATDYSTQCQVQLDDSSQLVYVCPDGSIVPVPTYPQEPTNNGEVTCEITEGQYGTLFVTCSNGSTYVVDSSAPAPNTAMNSAQLVNITTAQNLGLSSSLPLIVRLTDSLGTPIPNVSVFFAENSNNASLSASVAKTDGNGVAYVTFYSTTRTDLVLVTASVPGIEEGTVEIAVNVVPGAPYSLAILSGNKQSAEVTTTLPLPLSTAVKDRYGNNISGLNMFFSSASGSTLSEFAVLTNSGGEAQVYWSLGTQATTYVAQITTTTGLKITALAYGKAGLPAQLLFSNNTVTTRLGFEPEPALYAFVSDQYGNPCSNIEIAISVDPLTSMYPQFTTSNSAGRAAVPITTQELGTYEMTASYGALITNATLSSFYGAELTFARSENETLELYWQEITAETLLGYKVYLFASATSAIGSGQLLETLYTSSLTHYSIDLTEVATSVIRLAAVYPNGIEILSNKAYAFKEFSLDLGASAFDFEFSPDKMLLYVSVPNLGKILVFETLNWQLVREYLTGSKPYGIALNQSGTKLYTALWGSGSVAEIDTISHAITVRILTVSLDNASTFDVVVDKNQKVYVSASPDSGGFAYIVKMDPASGYALTRVAGGRIIRARPTFLYQENSNALYLGEGFSPNSLYKLDISQAAAPIVAEDDHGSVSGTGAMAIHPDGATIYTAAGIAIQTSTIDVVGSHVAGFPLIDMAGEYLYVSSGGSYFWTFGGASGPTIYIVDTRTSLIEKQFLSPRKVDRMTFLIDRQAIIALDKNILYGFAIPK